ncbi:sulfatase-like hydrolase/transferase [Priestia aryabhattai]
MQKQPNFLLIIVDEERFPPLYESKELKKWRKKHLKAHEFLKQHGMEFTRHYVGSTACSPSRATLFTGQYPSLHGVTQTQGIAKKSQDPDMFWLQPNTIPTMGDYFKQAGYQTFYKGKWHISDENILIPGTHNVFSSYQMQTGIPDLEKECLYQQANKLEKFGFSGWIGPEPEGRNPHNSGSSAAVGVSGRDEIYAEEIIELIQRLEHQKTAQPWLMVGSFVNPHDIALFGAITKHLPMFQFSIDETIPNIDPPPTIRESLQTKPSAQSSYKYIYPKALQPTPNSSFYRRLYYQLQKNVDKQILKVLRTIEQSSFYENTIIIFTSDHGDLLGAHGGLHQKWYNMYEESIHVPLLIHNKHLFPNYQRTDLMTSHVDLIPTMLSLANIDASAVQKQLQKSHTEVHPFVGRDLSGTLRGETSLHEEKTPIFFMTDDDPTKGLHQTNFLGESYPSVVQPNHIQAVIVEFSSAAGKEIWKYARYHDNPQFWSAAEEKDKVNHRGQYEGYLVSFTTLKTTRVPDQIEMYNLTKDPLETVNLAHPYFSTNETRKVQRQLDVILKEQIRKKRIFPQSGSMNDELSDKDR